MDSFGEHTPKKGAYLYARFDLSQPPQLSALKSRVFFGYFYDDKKNNELMQFNMTFPGNWFNALLVVSRDKLIKENPNSTTMGNYNTNIVANDSGRRALAPMIIPKKSTLIVLIPDAQYKRIKEGKKTSTFFDYTAGSFEAVRTTILNVTKYGLQKVYDVKISPESYYNRSTRALLQNSVSLDDTIKFVKSNPIP